MPRFHTTACSWPLTLMLTAVIPIALASHFRGGTISWRPVGGNEVEFYFKMGWTYGSGPGCTENKIGQYVDDDLLGGRAAPSDWKCLKGCQGQPVIQSASYFCMAANKQEQWEQGQNTFNYTFDRPGRFEIGFEGNAWMKLDNGKGDGAWSIATTVDLRARSDTGRPNSSPVSISQTLYYMQYDCHHVLRIPVLDPDGDEVRCHWAAGDECKAVCNALPGGQLDEKTCTITFDTTQLQNYNTSGYYAVALTIKDYPKTAIKLNSRENKTPSDSLSSVPIQTPTFPVKCEEKPRFIQPTPAEGSETLVQAGDTLSLRLVADNSNDTSMGIRTIDVIGPVALQQSTLNRVPNLPNTFQKTLTWQTTDTDVGEHIVCANAANERGKTGDPRCFTIKIVPDPCLSDPCTNGGTCQSNMGVFTCLCVLGFSGHLCQHNIDDCNPNPCQNGASCLDQVNGYTCVCPAGYTGTTCGTDINECNPNPCQNGATCLDQVNSYTCVCPVGYTDTTCGIDIDDCNPDPCHNGGICQDLVNDYSCACVPGYTDKNCSKDIDDCSPDPCDNGGTCQDLVNGYSCACVPGFTDTNCSTDIDDCSPDPCQNGGLCHDRVNDFVCDCRPGYTGKKCATDIDDCLPRPCKNGALCYDLVTDYVCVCAPGFTDKNCSTDIDECVSDPCLNGGTCLDVTNDFTCTCPPGFTGKHCHVGINFCAPKPCLNGGVCYNSFTGFRCQCVDGWLGEICDYRPGYSDRSTCKKREVTTLSGQGINPNSCCQSIEYSNCKCFLSPYVSPEESEIDSTARGLLCGLIGFPLGLGLSVLTYFLFRWCTASYCGVESYRASHPPAKRIPSRTQTWVNDQMPSVDSPEPRDNSPTYNKSSNDKLPLPRSSVTNIAAQATPAVGPSLAGSVTPMNIYRASFNDESMHSTGPKKYPDTYLSGARDWSSC